MCLWNLAPRYPSLRSRKARKIHKRCDIVYRGLLCNQVINSREKSAQVYTTSHFRDLTIHQVIDNHNNSTRKIATLRLYNNISHRVSQQLYSLAYYLILRKKCYRCCFNNFNMFILKHWSNAPFIDLWLYPRRSLAMHFVAFLCPTFL